MTEPTQEENKGTSPSPEMDQAAETPILAPSSQKDGEKGPPSKQWKIHPVAAAYPPSTEEEYQRLLESIRKNRVRVPAWVHGDDLLDGRNRDRACQELGIELPTQEWDGKGSLVEFVANLNVDRRSLTKAQRAAVAVNNLPLLEKEAEARKKTGKSADGQGGGRGKKKNLTQKVGGGLEPKDKHSGEAAEKAAQIFGVSRVYIGDAKKVKEKNQKAFKKLLNGKVTLQDALEEAGIKTKVKKKKLSGKKAAPKAVDEHRNTADKVNPPASPSAPSEPEGTEDSTPIQTQQEPLAQNDPVPQETPNRRSQSLGTRRTQTRPRSRGL